MHILTISEKHIDYANEIGEKLKMAGVRIETDDSDNTIGKKIRTHRKMQPAYMLVIGDEEISSSTVSIRNRAGEQVQGVQFDDFMDNLLSEISTRSSEQNLVN